MRKLSIRFDLGLCLAFPGMIDRLAVLKVLDSGGPDGWPRDRQAARSLDGLTPEQFSQRWTEAKCASTDCSVLNPGLNR